LATQEVPELQVVLSTQLACVEGHSPTATHSLAEQVRPELQSEGALQDALRGPPPQASADKKQSAANEARRRPTATMHNLQHHRAVWKRASSFRTVLKSIAATVTKSAFCSSLKRLAKDWSLRGSGS
jgi:hypothetical protein